MSCCHSHLGNALAVDLLQNLHAADGSFTIGLFLFDQLGGHGGVLPVEQRGVDPGRRLALVHLGQGRQLLGVGLGLLLGLDLGLSLTLLKCLPNLIVMAGHGL